jgi:hypothetical protein
MPVLFFIDDEDSYTSAWRKSLASAFEVKYYDRYPGFDELYDDIINHDPEIIIQDVMMASPGARIVNTEAGLEIAESLKDTLVRLNIPLMFFSNRELPDFQDDFDALGYPQNLLHYRSKFKVGFQNLLAEVNDILRVCKKSGESM